MNGLKILVKKQVVLNKKKKKMLEWFVNHPLTRRYKYRSFRSTYLFIMRLVARSATRLLIEVDSEINPLMKIPFKI